MSAALQPLPTPAEVSPTADRERQYSRLGDYATLLKVRVTSLVVLTAWTGHFLGAQLWDDGL